MSIVTIPSPCHEKVSEMLRSVDGYHCVSCSHVVVDFTNKTDDEIVKYLSERNGLRTCGHFRNDQVKRRSDWPFEMVRFVAALAIAFGSMLFISSCGTTGESEAKRKADSIKAADSIAKTEREYLTGVVLCEPPVIQDSLTADSLTLLGWADFNADSTK